jgi:hypothetical protein
MALHVHDWLGTATCMNTETIALSLGALNIDYVIVICIVMHGYLLHPLYVHNVSLGYTHYM